VIFGVACTVGSIVGYLVQQFIIGTGIAKVLGKLKRSHAGVGGLPDGPQELLPRYLCALED
jgi:hypothetical protein